ncbi:MAG TPA: hypothetical protein VEF04_03520 [Blastocatellia bacterium]|jgi:hypothetical protein|nr:hypothetical protein [Blastocatellia bacterium]
MSFREQLTSCPRCRMVINIESIMIDERATVRILGKCSNPNCNTQSICRDIDPIQVAAYESSLLRMKQRTAPPKPRNLGH